MSPTRRALLATGAALPFLRHPARVGIMSGRPVFGPPSLASRANSGSTLEAMTIS